jgi:putative membrane protein
VKDKIRTMVNGFCMALADSVPGVSGGTIAFIMGFYENLLNSFHGLLFEQGEKRKESGSYLIKLGCGWAVGMGFALVVLSHLLNSNIYLMTSAFLGLTLAAIPLIVRTEHATLRGKQWMLVFTLIGALFVVGISLLRQVISGPALDFSMLTGFEYIYIFIAGAVAVSAMILPGISGSTLLLIFGVYAPMVLSVHELMNANFAVLPGLLVLVVGIVFGLTCAIKVVRALLQKHRSAMIYLILGLVMGSTFAIVMGPTTMATPAPPLSVENFNIIAFAVGAGLVVGLEAIAHNGRKIFGRQLDKTGGKANDGVGNLGNHILRNAKL